LDRVDITIIGAGAVGLAIASKLSDKASVLVLEKYPGFGQEASSRNSEVIHSGIYYPSNSLKAGLCVRGRKLLYGHLKKNSINHRKTGKIIVATDKQEEPELEALKKKGLDNGVEGLKLLSGRELEALEPEVRASAGLLSPETGILDSHQLMQSFVSRLRTNKAIISYNSEVSGINRIEGGYEVRVAGEDLIVSTRALINAAGVNSGRIAAMAGINIDESGYKIYTSKGRYFRINSPLKINKLIYPVPSAELSDLGIHITKDLAGGLRIGPDAEYVTNVDYNVDEMKRQGFFDSASKYLKNLNISDLSPDTCGIRAKLQGPGQGFRDFVIKHESDKGLPGLINLVGIESPGLTSCLAIAEYVEKLLSDFSLL
jgi:L-2-hydroxyglutarate oxidase LhgO